MRKIEEYNAKFPDEKLPFIVIVIDELADLMMIAPGKVETNDLPARATRPGDGHSLSRRDPASVRRRDHRHHQSEHPLAHRLRGQLASRLAHDPRYGRRGAFARARRHALFAHRCAKAGPRSRRADHRAARCHGSSNFGLARRGRTICSTSKSRPIEDDDRAQREVDALWYDAARFIIESKFASTAQLQQRFSIGHPRAVRIMKQLEESGVVGPHEGTKARQINIGLGELDVLSARLGRPGQTDMFAQGA